MAKPNPKARKNIQKKTMSNSVMSHKIGALNGKITKLENEMRDLKIAFAEMRVELKEFLPQEDEDESKEIEEFEVEDRRCETCSELNMEDKNCRFHVEKGASFPCRKWKKKEDETEETENNESE